jgi:hypothetical protein
MKIPRQRASSSFKKKKVKKENNSLQTRCRIVTVDTAYTILHNGEPARQAARTKLLPHQSVNGVAAINIPLGGNNNNQIIIKQGFEQKADDKLRR